MEGLAFVVPLAGAAVLLAIGWAVPRWVNDSIALATGIATAALCADLLHRTGDNTVVTWFGGWRPTHGPPIGVDFAVDRFGAGLATLVAVLACASLVFVWRYFATIHALFHALFLVFVAGMVGFCLSGDLFNLFVLFELMGVAAFALTAYEVEEEGPLQGALNFAVTNSVGAIAILFGTGMLYGRTGALNLAQIGASLAVDRHGTDGLVVVALVLVIGGYLVKAAAVPFHFWLPDAHAVAPSPVCALFSGAMVSMGVYAVARVFWTVFAPVLTRSGSLAGVRPVLVAFGVAGVVVGAAMCTVQRHLKRLLAFSTVSHVGIVLVGVGVLNAHGLAGAAVYLVGHGLVKASLFLCAGVLLHRLGTVWEPELHGRGRSLPVLGVVMAVGALVLAGLPPAGTFTGRALLDEAVAGAGYRWLPPLFAVASAVTAGALLRVVARTFLGVGPRPAADEFDLPTDDEDDEGETQGARDRVPATMLAPPIALLGLSFAVGAAPSWVAGAGRAAARFVDIQAYRAAVLHAAGDTVRVPVPHLRVAAAALVPATLTVLGAILVGALPLSQDRLPNRLRVVGRNVAHRALRPLRLLHSGSVLDDVTWLLVGLAAFGAAGAVLWR